MAVQDIIDLLNGLDLDKLREEAMADVRSGKKTRRQAAVKKLRAIEGLKRSGVTPQDLLVKRVPVIPAAFRPYSQAGDTFIPGDANELYSDLHKAVQVHKETVAELGEEGAEDSASYLRSAVNAVYGYDDSPNPKIRNRRVSGFLTKILGCHDDKTEILTEKRGWVLFRDLVQGEAVGTVNPVTLLLEWQIPSAYVDQPYCGSMFHFHYSTRLGAVVTPDHDMFFRKRMGKTNHAGDLSDGWSKSPAYRTAADKGRLWFMTTPMGWEGGVPPEVPTQLRGWSAEEFAEWCGWWVAEGWITGNRPGVSQSLAANPDKHARLESMFSRLSGQVSRFDRKDDSNEVISTDWYVGDEKLAEWVVYNFGKGASGKKISAAVRNWAAPYLRSFVKGYLAGDGSARGHSDSKKPFTPAKSRRRGNHFNSSTVVDNQSSFATCSKQLADDLSEVFLKLGCTATVPEPHVDERHEHWKDMYYVPVSGRFNITVEAPVRGEFHELVHYDGRVYCCTVANHLLVTRRDGKTLVSGNSNPKVSWVQSKLLAKPQDFVGRGVITPNPDLGMDEVAIPKDMAWTLADPHLQKNLVAQGIPTSRAMEMIRDRHPTAQKVLEKVMRDIPVIYSRSPAWHAQNVISGYARIADGDNIEVSPLTTAGYSGDFDGDCKSMNEKDLWSIDGVIYFDTFARLVKLLNPEFPVTESSLHPIAEGRLKVVSFLEGRPVWLPVSHVHFHTKHGESVRVNLRSGFSLVTTDDHGLMTYDENLDLVQVSPAAISGGLVPVAAFLPVAVTVSEVEIAGEKQPLDYAFGYCIGHYLGDGGAYDSTSHVRLTSDDAGHLANMKDTLQWLNLAPILTNEKHKGFRILNDGFWDWFREQFDSGSFNKRIPAWVFSSPEVFRRGILDGAISTDGRVHACEKHAACNIGMENLDLIESLAVLCRTLGVWCGMGGIESGHYKLILDPEDLGWLTLTHPGRNEELKKLRLLRDSKRRQYKKVIPWNRTVSTMCLAALGLGLTVARTRFALFASSYTKKGFVSLVEAQRLSAALPSTGLPELLAKWVALVASKDSWGEVVTSVEIIEREPVTFDVTVPGPHLTVCPVQGLVTHQTMSVHFPAMPESIKDARERLLPSIQAFSVRNRDETLPVPKHEQLLGLAGSQLVPSGTIHRVASQADALAGIKNGTIKLQDQVEIGPDPMQGLGSQILGSVGQS